MLMKWVEFEVIIVPGGLKKIHINVPHIVSIVPRGDGASEIRMAAQSRDGKGLEYVVKATPDEILAKIEGAG